MSINELDYKWGASRGGDAPNAIVNKVSVRLEEE